MTFTLHATLGKKQTSCRKGSEGGSTSDEMGLLRLAVGLVLSLRRKSPGSCYLRVCSEDQQRQHHLELVWNTVKLRTEVSARVLALHTRGLGFSFQRERGQQGTELTWRLRSAHTPFVFVFRLGWLGRWFRLSGPQ